MTKGESIADPNSCYNRAYENEPIFTLLGRDLATPTTIRFWVEERIRLGKNNRSDPQIVAALAEADEIERYHNR